MARWIILIIQLNLLVQVGLSNSMPNPKESKSTSNMCNCTVNQGDIVYDLDFFSEPMTAVEFYSYGFPDAASANTTLEVSNGLIIMLYEDSNTGITSLITILDEANDGSGGSANISFNCLPSNAFVELADDGGEYSGSPPNIIGNFNWAPCCTDGGIIGNIGCGDTFIINPDIGSGISDFIILSGNLLDPEYIEMADINCTIVIDCGGPYCCDEAFEFDSEVQDATCSVSEDGSIDLSTDCAAEPTFNWSNGATTEDLTNIGPGLYSVIITDANGCTEASSFMVDSNSDPSPDIDGPTVICANETSIQLEVEDEYDEYIWSTGDDTQEINVNEGGLYSVTITNALGCTGTADYLVIDLPNPEPFIEGPTETCFDIDIVLDAGDGYADYDWSNGSGAQMIYVFQEETYTVTVTDENGCTGTASTEILVNPVPDAEIIGPDEICLGDEIMLFAGEEENADDYEYIWSTGEDTQSICINEDGEYSVTVTNEYDCFITDIIYVDPVPGAEPEIIGLTSFCIADTILLELEEEFDEYIWSTGEDSPSITTTTPGSYSVTVTNDHGCEGISEIQIMDGSADSTIISLTSCNPLDTGVFISYYENQHGCDSLEILSIEFSEADSVFLFSQSCNPLDTGLFVLTHTNQFGCDSLQFDVVSLLPSDSIHIELFSCMPQDTGIAWQNLTNQYGCDSLIITKTILTAPDTSIVEFFTCDPFEVGTSELLLTSVEGCDSLIISQTKLLPSDSTWIYYESCLLEEVGLEMTSLINQYGCDSLIFEQTNLLSVEDCVLDVSLLLDTIPCSESEGSLWLTIYNGTAPLNYNWYNSEGKFGQGAINQIGVPVEISGLPAGIINIDINDPEGYSLSLDAFIHQAEAIQLELMADSDFSGFGISCFGESDGGISISSISGGIPPYNYQWSTGTGGQALNNLSAGLYALTVTDGYGCIAIDTVMLEEPEALNLEFSIQQPDCHTNGLGTVVIENTSGGVKPYQFTIDDNNWQIATAFNFLDSGNYLLEFEDSNGCRLASQIEIKDYENPDVWLSEDLSILAGQTIKLTASSNIDFDEYEIIYWEGIDCEGCSNVEVTPLESSYYTIVVVDSLGCEARDEILVIVKQPIEIYTPNIFSPDSDGVNDHFTIFSNQPATIKEMLIFDRWGALIYTIENLPTNDPNQGWDGRFRGQDVASTVFVYYAVIEFPDGTIRKIHGDVLVAN